MYSYNKIQVIERCTNMFICSICCDPKTPGPCKPFSTSTASLFLEHQRCNHSSVTDVECIYCCCKVPCSQLVQHIQNHFLSEEETQIRCQKCLQTLKPHWRTTIHHMTSHHSDNDGFVCPHCYGKFLSIDSLECHLQESELILFHCISSDCFVKSHNKQAILSHLNSRHKGSRCMRISCQFLCTERLAHNTKYTCLCSSIPLAASPAKVINGIKDECQLIDLPYSSRVLAKLSIGLDDRLQDDLCLKMEQYSKFKVRMEVVDGQKQFVCSTCQYRSVHSLADVRKHILGCHCSVSTSYTRLCLRASRLDTNNFTLFSDRKLISFANEKLKRAESGSGWDGTCDYTGLQLLDDSEQESGSNSGSFVRASKRQSYSTGQETSIKKAKIKQRQSNVAKMRPDSPVPEVGPPLERSENFDRVINLNYSWPVLERLVLGQCPERYLFILKQKMDVYSQHRILLTRRNGKRYFLCSHCPNCSPHGMNDIRKHILGVHARLPERFKSAAMYCSRMNRDNYGLLSDDELLKKNQDMVRWRATPSEGAENFVMEPLAPLHRSSSSPEDNNASMNNDENNKSHNIFLSGDNGEGSPNSLNIVNEPLSVQLASCYQNYSQMSFPSLISSILANNNNNNNNNNNDINNDHDHNNNDLSDESSPKLDDNSSVTSNVNIPPKGCSRRSLVLKSKTTNHNSLNINNS